MLFIYIRIIPVLEKDPKINHICYPQFIRTHIRAQIEHQF